jgi:hypothetical protein
MMIEAQATDHEAQTVSLKEYAANLARSGIQVLPGAPGTFWTRYLYGSVMRKPAFHVGPPAPGELREVLWRWRAAVASYLLEPDERHPANAWLYLCTDHDYALEKLAYTMRKNVRRGFKELMVAPLTSEQLLAHGTQAFCDTRSRLGLNDGTPEVFRRLFTAQVNWPEIIFLGAWKDNQLAAFLSIIEVEDWTELHQIFSMDAMLQYRPNDALMYRALSHYLVERKCRLVSSGVSSIQVESNTAGLHRFKTKVGFKARPVHRAFVAHPLLRPFVNRVTLWGVNTALRFRPGDRRLQEAGGVLACMLGDTSALEAAVRSTSEE